MSYETARENMVLNQLKPNKVSNPDVLNAFRSIPREYFVDSSCKTSAYSEEQVIVAENRPLLSPMIIGRLLNDLKLSGNETMLVIAANTGYTAAVASKLVKKVYAVESDSYLTDAGKRALSDCKCSNAELICSEPEKGLKKKAPYDVIFVDAPTASISETLIEQVKDGGKIAAVVELEGHVLEATIYTKQGNTLFEEALLETHGQVLENFKKEESFVF